MGSFRFATLCPLMSKIGDATSFANSLKQFFPLYYCYVETFNRFVELPFPSLEPDQLFVFIAQTSMITHDFGYVTTSRNYFYHLTADLLATLALQFSKHIRTSKIRAKQKNGR